MAEYGHPHRTAALLAANLVRDNAAVSGNIELRRKYEAFVIHFDMTPEAAVAGGHNNAGMEEIRQRVLEQRRAALEADRQASIDAFHEVTGIPRFADGEELRNWALYLATRQWCQETGRTDLSTVDMTKSLVQFRKTFGMKPMAAANLTEAQLTRKQAALRVGKRVARLESDEAIRSAYRGAPVSRRQSNG